MRGDCFLLRSPAVACPVPPPPPPMRSAEPRPPPCPPSSPIESRPARGCLQPGSRSLLFRVRGGCLGLQTSETKFQYKTLPSNGNFSHPPPPKVLPCLLTFDKRGSWEEGQVRFISACLHPFACVTYEFLRCTGASHPAHLCHHQFPDSA